MSVKKFLTFLFFTTLMVPTCVYSQGYISAGYNYGQFSYAPMKDLNIGPKGGGPGFTLGVNHGVVSTELFYNKLSMSSDIIHDGSSNSINHNSTTAGFALNVFASKFFYFRFGYQFSQIRQSFTSVNTATDTVITEKYGILSDYSGKGVLFGIGANLYGGKSWNIFSQLISSEVHEQGKELLIHAGFRLHFNTKSLFSK